MIYCGIYKITNKETKKCYIGQSVDIIDRLQQHLTKKYDPTDWHTEFQHEPEKYTFEILTQCSEADLDEKENYYIHKYNSVEAGYNKRYGNKDQFNVVEKSIQKEQEKINKVIKPPVTPKNRPDLYPYSMNDITNIINATSQAIYGYIKKYHDFFEENSIRIKRRRWYNQTAFDCLMNYYGEK